MKLFVVVVVVCFEKYFMDKHDLYGELMPLITWDDAGGKKYFHRHAVLPFLIKILTKQKKCYVKIQTDCFHFFVNKTFKISWILLQPDCLHCCFGMEISVTWGEKKGFQFSHISILGMKKFQTPALDQAGTLCLATELSASRAASLCFDPLIRLLAAMAKGPDWRAAQECHWQGGCALLGLMDRVLKVPWHSTHPDSFPGCSHHCLLHSALQQGSPGLPGSVYTSLWTQAPSVYPHCQK